MKKLFFLITIFLFCCDLIGQSKTENVVIITLDGVRWKEIFRGADSTLIFNDKFRKSEAKRLTGKFWSDSLEKRRSLLTPFLWNYIVQNGRIYGNRDLGNKVAVANKTNISYPGYSEIFTGYADPQYDSNEMRYNDNTNLLEYLDSIPEFQGKVSAFASWDRIHGYLNSDKNNFVINGGFNAFKKDSITALQETLNNLQEHYHGSESSRPDYITYLHAKEYIRIQRPKIISIGFAWSDDMAHDGSYPKYLDKIFLFDNMIEELWGYIQSLSQYKNKTTLLITVDHGRGDNSKWVAHGPEIPHSNETWFAIMGPEISGKGEISTSMTLYQNQYAQTIAHLLGLEFDPDDHEVGEKIEF